MRKPTKKTVIILPKYNPKHFFSHKLSVKQFEPSRVLFLALIYPNSVQLMVENIYRVIHKSLRDFRTRLLNNQERHG